MLAKPFGSLGHCLSNHNQHDGNETYGPEGILNVFFDASRSYSLKLKLNELSYIFLPPFGEIELIGLVMSG